MTLMKYTLCTLHRLMVLLCVCTPCCLSTKIAGGLWSCLFLYTFSQMLKASLEFVELDLACKNRPQNDL